MIVLDTNVISELALSTPDAAVVRWFAEHDDAELWLSTITVGELHYGAERLPAGRRQAEVRSRVERSVAGFADRIVAFDEAAAVVFGHVMARRERAGRPVGTADAQIAAICLANGAELATRNVKDFADTGVDVVNPWSLPRTADA